MFTSYNYAQWLRTALLSTVMLFAVIGTKNVLAIGIDVTSGNYDDGKLVYSTNNQKLSHQLAVNFCESKSNDGVKWELATPLQIKEFYQKHIAGYESQNHLRSNGWDFDTVWTSEKVGLNNYEVVNLSNGIYELNGREATQHHNFVCVANIGDYFYDGTLTWSKITSNKMAFKEAKKYCAEIKPGNWTLPDRPQLIAFSINVVNKRSAAMTKGGWTLGPTWTSREENLPDGSTSYSLVDLASQHVANVTNVGNRSDFKHFVTCVKPNSSR